jgi:hypothetical protein
MEEDEETEEANDVAKNKKPNNLRFSQRKDTGSNIYRMIMKRLESCSDDCDNPRKIKRSKIKRQRM